MIYNSEEEFLKARQLAAMPRSVRKDYESYLAQLNRFNDEEPQMQNYAQAGSPPPTPNSKPMLDEFRDDYQDLLSRLNDKVNTLHAIADRFIGPTPAPISPMNKATPADPSPALVQRLNEAHSQFNGLLEGLQHAINRLGGL